MIRNFTPLDLTESRHSNKSINTVLLLIATLTTLVLVILLFILIQKKIRDASESTPPASQQSDEIKVNKTNTNIPTLILSPTVSFPLPTPVSGLINDTPSATPSGQLEILPTDINDSGPIP